MRSMALSLRVIPRSAQYRARYFRIIKVSARLLTYHQTVPKLTLKPSLKSQNSRPCNRGHCRLPEVKGLGKPYTRKHLEAVVPRPAPMYLETYDLFSYRGSRIPPKKE